MAGYNQNYLTPSSGQEPGESFAQTGAEFSLDDSEIGSPGYLATPTRSTGFRPGHISPSFAQTGAELDLDDSDEEDDEGEDEEEDDFDLRSEVVRDAGSAAEVYQMVEQNQARRDLTVERPWEGNELTSPRPDMRNNSTSSVASFQLYTPDEEIAVRRKLDRKLVLFVALLFLLSFLDRSNIGNARIAGMDKDLQTKPPRDDWYDWSLTAFYISYISFEWMALLWRLIPAHKFVCGIVIAWGATAALQYIAPSYPVLIFFRVVLGISEAGFTGIPFYLSFFFKRDELAFRTAMFISAAPLATSFASSLAWVIVKCAELSPIAPWRLLFLIEGFPSVIAGVIAFRVIPDSPQTVSYFTKRERKVARLRLRGEKPTPAKPDQKEDPGSGGSQGQALLAVFRDPVAWISAAMFFLSNMAYSSLPVFLPKILTEMGFNNLSAQALSAPPYLVAFLLVLVTAHLSDRFRTRTVPIVLHATASAAGYAILALAEPMKLSPFFRYVAVYPAAAGFFNVVTLIITWSINNQANQSRQGGGFALLQLIGQCGPLVGTRLYPVKDGPYYAHGMRTCFWAMLGVAILAIILRVYMSYQNRKMDRLEKERGSELVDEEEEGLVGNGRRQTQPDSFRYML
ncbi:unnamed protein product [Clonostachys byssicola]|uniref:Major facilitator superfamily (MFS) profile domain-containing protein n=1 Tax=Clonostachys byssicola TaxID=160290 RepID=A0A9N9UYL2_9HYPO|nr:unnamed protein product [Clonostachys byssicola]